ncbi:hypothetical protein [Nocardia nova]
MSGDSYDDIRRGHDSNTRGRIFENGTDRYFRDRQRGYQQQSREYATPFGKRRFDKARASGRERGRVDSIEDKSGRLGGKKDENQLRKDHYLLSKNVVSQYRLRTVEGEKISKTARELIDKLSRDFPDRFTHQIISRTQATQIYANGREREKDSRQLELYNAQALQRRQRAAQRLEKVRVAARRLHEREQQRRDREDRRRRAAERLPKVREAAERLRLRREQQGREAREQKVREASERVAREFGEVMKNIKRRDRDAKKARDAREARLHAELHELSVYAEQIQQAREAADAADQARLEESAKAEERARLEREATERARQQREQADAHLRSRLPPDVADLLLLGRPTPGLESPHREPPSAGSTRGGRTERSRARAREREGRGRGI